MQLKQISVFVENKPGAVSRPCRVLGDAGVDITTLTLADTKDFGILRIITKDWRKAYDTLKQQKFAVSVTDVLALQVENVPGGLANLLEAIQKAGLNVEYMYATVTGKGAANVLVFRFDDTDGAVEKLKKRPEFKIVDETTFFSL